jgi:hypothetical protein
MKNRNLYIGLGGLIAGVVALVVIVTAAFTPESTEPAFNVATTFVNAAASGDEFTAYPLLSPELQAWALANCPGGRVVACVKDYTPEEWGQLASAEFRRSARVGAAWDIDLIGYYDQPGTQGFSGVCVYTRVEELAPGDWRIAAWAGWAWCGDPTTRNMARNPDAPNSAP